MIVLSSSVDMIIRLIPTTRRWPFDPNHLTSRQLGNHRLRVRWLDAHRQRRVRPKTLTAESTTLPELRPLPEGESFTQRWLNDNDQVLGDSTRDLRYVSILRGKPLIKRQEHKQTRPCAANVLNDVHLSHPTCPDKFLCRRRERMFLVAFSLHLMIWALACSAPVSPGPGFQLREFIRRSFFPRTQSEVRRGSIHLEDTFCHCFEF